MKLVLSARNAQKIGTMALAVTAALGIAGNVHAETDIYDPNGIAVGTQYQLVFVTTGTIVGSDSLAQYNSLVQTEAAASSLAGLNTTWKAIVSESPDDPGGGLAAINNIGGNNTANVYNLNGGLVASAANPLFGTTSAAINPIDITQTGATVANGTFVWTGTDITTGGGELGEAMDNSSNSTAEVGIVGTGNTYMTDGTEGQTNTYRIYAISGVLTATPEPSTTGMMVLGGALLVFGAYRKRRRLATGN